MSEERAVQGHLCWNEEVKPMINSKPIARRKLILPDQGLNMHESPDLSPEFIEALKQVSKADLSCIVTY